MNRFEQKPTPIIYAAIVLSMAAVLVADILTPLGTAVWVFYLIPLVLSLFVWRPVVPLVVASLVTALMIYAFLTDPPGVNRNIASLNRGFGIFTIWVISGVCFQFIQNRLAVRKQEWLQTGQTRLSRRMGGEQPLEDLGNKILQFLSEYLDAHAGAIFMEEDGGFRRFASYALPAETTVPERMGPGEGLVGQAVKDGRTFIVRDVPDNYMQISSGTGRSRPRHILVAPFHVDERVNAVLELGFLHPVYDADTELLERIGESVGVAVRSSQYRKRLQELLEETQRQAEELQAQSEELRVSNEELAEQSRALQESQTRLELQQAELEQTNTQLEEQAQLLETQKDDLSQSKDELQRQTRELAQSSRYKSEFLANMSHELRTPLNSSLIMAKLLADNQPGNLNEEQVRYAQTIQSSGRDLLNLINDILDLSKIEAGRMEVRPEMVRLPRLLENLRHVFLPVASQKSLDLRMEFAPGTPDSIETDPQRLEQILKNLLSNALKFTESGEVVLDVRFNADKKLSFAVKDTGIGIPEGQLDIVFEAFRQADGTTNRKYGGTGLGLSISRDLARLLGGDIDLTSETGQGSTFTLTLPLVYDPSLARQAPTPKTYTQPGEAEDTKPARSTASQRPPTRTPAPVTATRHIDDDRQRLSGDRRVILFVEDDEPFAEILYDLAHELNFQVLIATTAEEGLAVAAQFLPSAVVLDVGLPDNSGLSVLDRLKSDSRTRHIPVHMVSASDYSETAFALGAVGYMLKPVKREELMEAFERLETKLTQKMRRVLIVEDDPIQIESLQQLLRSQDVETEGARSAEECLEKLKTATYDCMVLDLTLPDASGFSLLETLSQEDRYSFPPVIVYTGQDLSADDEQKLRRYSKSIIIKGARSPERLLDEVTLFLHQVVSELPPEQQRMLEKARSRDAALEGRHILVVEDDVRNVFALTSILEPKGATVQIVRNGREALDALARSAQAKERSIDLVLMDIMMPEMDGLTAMREIRKNPEWKKLPIIALTAKAMKNDQEEALEAGANDYMSKPLDVDKLLSLVRVWMPR